MLPEQVINPEIHLWLTLLKLENIITGEIITFQVNDRVQ